MENINPTHIGVAVLVVACLVVIVDKVLGIAGKVRELRTRDRAAEPVDAASFEKHIAWATQQNHDRRDQGNALALKVAVIEQSLDNGLTRRVESLEERQEVMASKLDRCVFILEQEFGSKHRRAGA